jgi:hypothetical protein
MTSIVSPLSSVRARVGRLDSYLVAGVHASTLALSGVEAAIVQIDVGPTGFNIGGLNAGLALGSTRQMAFPTSDQYWLGLFNNYADSSGYFTIRGLAMGPTAGIAFNGGYVAPRNFARDAVIDSSATFTSEHLRSVFSVQTPNGTFVSPDFGPDSFIGFRSSLGSYGWLEATWSQAASQFEILSGAYEDQPGVGIPAGAVPEPAAGTLAALALGSAAIARWRSVRGAKSSRCEPADSL